MMVPPVRFLIAHQVEHCRGRRVPTVPVHLAGGLDVSLTRHVLQQVRQKLPAKRPPFPVDQKVIPVITKQIAGR